jgi:hypothetical protein
MPNFHSSMEQPGRIGALHWNGVAVSFSDGRLEVDGYPIPREALVASLHTRRPRKTRGESQAPQNAGIGRDVLPQNVGCHVLSHLIWWHVQSLPDTAASRQAPTSTPIRRTSLLHPGGSGLSSGSQV